MKTFFTTILALVCITTMVSCSDADVFDDEMIGRAKGTRVSSEDAYVRIGMYESIEGYNLHVEDMRVENCISTGEDVQFGSNITAAKELPSSADKAIFDNADSKYNPVTYYYDDAWIVLHFDVVLTSDTNFNSKVRIDDVKYYISPEESKWIQGGHYEYIINLDKDFLNLSKIEFGADVDDFQIVDADTNC